MDLPHLGTQEEVDALAPGSHFIWAPDGEEYIRQSTDESSEGFIDDVRDLIRAQGSHRFKRSFSEEMGKQAAQLLIILSFFGFIGLAYFVLLALLQAH